jgi:hypothetical protein
MSTTTRSNAAQPADGFSREEQGKHIRALLHGKHGKLTVGDPWFLVHTEWWRRWTTYSGYSEGDDVQEPHSSTSSSTGDCTNQNECSAKGKQKATYVSKRTEKQQKKKQKGDDRDDGEADDDIPPPGKIANLPVRFRGGGGLVGVCVDLC